MRHTKRSWGGLIVFAGGAALEYSQIGPCKRRRGPTLLFSSRAGTKTGSQNLKATQQVSDGKIKLKNDGPPPSHLPHAGAIANANAPKTRHQPPPRKEIQQSNTKCPFPETKPVIGGFSIFEVASREEAQAWATKIAKACRCAQEVREIMYDPES